MYYTLATLLFKWTRWGRCPCCHSWSRFSRPVPALSGPIPAEVQGLVPLITRCGHGCTSSVQAVTHLEHRPATQPVVAEA